MSLTVEFMATPSRESSWPLKLNLALPSSCGTCTLTLTGPGCALAHSSALTNPPPAGSSGAACGGGGGAPMCGAPAGMKMPGGGGCPGACMPGACMLGGGGMMPGACMPGGGGWWIMPGGMPGGGGIPIIMPPMPGGGGMPMRLTGGGMPGGAGACWGGGGGAAGGGGGGGAPEGGGGGAAPPGAGGMAGVMEPATLASARLMMAATLCSEAAFSAITCWCSCCCCACACCRCCCSAWRASCLRATFFSFSGSPKTSSSVPKMSLRLLAMRARFADTSSCCASVSSFSPGLISPLFSFHFGSSSAIRMCSAICATGTCCPVMGEIMNPVAALPPAPPCPGW
mmetsp:Transcript_15995/g.37919  ORF Transcript_15995/g.37919 Transcript_15995/m.37919 type:complete len:341 (-) Transcript_15995:1132-2154(-)